MFVNFQFIELLTQLKMVGGKGGEDTFTNTSGWGPTVDVHSIIIIHWGNEVREGKNYHSIFNYYLILYQRCRKLG